jgi:hypothetical protein
MKKFIPLLCTAAVFSSLYSTAAANSVEGAASANTNVTVMLRGPIHEAFATQIQANPTAGMIVSKKPPQAIKEIPPDIRPKGDLVSWIPGYWAWDDADNDFIWISGVWRQSPPGRQWVPGYWAQAESGWQWHSGMWMAADVRTVSYKPMPKNSLEHGPSSLAPSQDYFWVPGCWIYQGNDYRWRAGFWAEGRPDWNWIPEHYVWTPRGAIYVSGYWDLPFSARGTLFAPVSFRGSADLGDNFRYTPAEVIDVGKIFLHLFARPDYQHYYFGDYYGDEYVKLGIRPWYEFHTAKLGYDPLLEYYVWDSARKGVDIIERLTGWHNYFLKEIALRPPRTIRGLTDFVAKNRVLEHVQQAVLGQPLGELLSGAGNTGQFVRLTSGQLSELTRTIDAINGLAGERLRLETRSVASVAAGPTGTVGNVAGGTADVAGVLKLPAITQPLQSATSGLTSGAVTDVTSGALNTIPGAGRAIQTLPAVPNVGGVLNETTKSVPTLPQVIGGDSSGQGGSVLGGLLGGNRGGDGNDDGGDE